MEFLKKATYSKPLRNIARFFHLSVFLRKIYFFYARPRTGVLEVEVGDIKSRFYVKTAEELRVLESMSNGYSGERSILEKMMSLLKPGYTVYDVGGHIGSYAIFLSKVVGPTGRVIVFEPESQNNKNLLDNIKLNNLNNVTVFQKALGNEEAKANLYLGEENGGSSLLDVRGKNAAFEQVDVVIGDQFVKNENLPIPNAIKIDVEGYEYNVIEGLTNVLKHPECRLLCCELHPILLPDGIDIDSLINLLKSVGFSDIEKKIREGEYHIIAKK